MSPSATNDPHSIPIPASLTSDDHELPTETASALLTYMRTDTTAIPYLSNLLSDSLNRTGWTDRVRALALELLRNGTCDTFPELMAEVMRRMTLPKETEKPISSKDKGKEVNGAPATTTAGAGPGGAATAAAQSGGAVNGNNAIALSKEWSGGPDGLPDVRVPYVTVEKGVAFIREKIEEICEVVEDEEDSD